MLKNHHLPFNCHFRDHEQLGICLHLKIMSTPTSFFLGFLLITFFSCSKDEEKTTALVCDGSNLTYNSGISSIINSNCNASNCHNAGSPHGGFVSYVGLQSVISSGVFNTRVLVIQDMPQGSAILTQNQLSKLKCWVDNDCPEN